MLSLLQSTIRRNICQKKIHCLPRIKSHVPYRTVAATSTNKNKVFDQKLKQLQKDNAARSHRNSLSHTKQEESIEYIDYDYLYEEIGARLVDRLDDIKKEDGFPLALDVGSGPGYLYRIVSSDDALGGEGGIGGVRKLVELDSSYEMLHRDDNIGISKDSLQRCGSYKLVNNSNTLPFPNDTFDLVISSMALHWVNDIELLLKEIKRVLRPDGCFMCAMIGGSTLTELRSSFVLAEMERDGGVSPRVGPFIDFADVGSLLTNAGFTLPTIDIDTINLSYPNAMVLMEHLQRMGESSANLAKPDRTSVDTFLATAAIYQEMYPIDSNEVQATVQVIYAIGWTPHQSQQKPKMRGSATHKIGNVT